MWLHFLKANYPDYSYITILTDCIVALLVNSNVFSSIASITDNALGLNRPAKPAKPADTLLNS